MLLLTICCCLLGVVCAGPRQDDIVDAATDQEAGDLKTMASLVDIMSEADVTSYEDILASNPDKDASWILHYIKENELADLDEEMVEEYFKGFIRMEMTSLMELVPEPLARFSGLRSRECSTMKLMGEFKSDPRKVKQSNSMDQMPLNEYSKRNMA
ncbi:uncharacterized protein [Cherax quadricarinatus]|uniref:uncharacterized protein isoform X2 n=1 Tax=Cherax quadricarinatus TaxID=27406 RepID=UPI002378A9C7|nr:uncharacterized protein LOC128684772 isoform X3 [Cherax quadricarinatus]